MSEEEVARYAYHSSNKSRKNPEVTRYAYALLNKSDFEHLGKALPPGCGIDRSLGKRGGPDGDDEGDSLDGTTSTSGNSHSRSSSRRSSGGARMNNSVEDSDRFAEALIDMSVKEDTREKNKAKQELNLRRLEIILQYGNEEQKNDAMRELIEMHTE